ncbi:hypothetical protein KEM48_008878 [Puccinia striiformis f. sp. tritici PST-130]|uniref:Uncharacterized protein n=2 Tax=Puccinia striiformis TaxID=27350 RepID=A0A0L0VIQ6_9BASI|nr:hypothetical protein Pst134EB_021949 [Puccinia striiformis f. sp. tritici]KAI9599664.1 hypothetical protein KEM48_008878 [Puccinia striiformis f. sp. tritici PST-130]KNE99172.1 hypothetical protein PSTG_07483 [Puccinia striiformis f. sp. tritici PST-78]
MMILSSYLVLVLVAIFHATPSSSSPSLWEKGGKMIVQDSDGRRVEVEGEEAKMLKEFAAREKAIEQQRAEAERSRQEWMTAYYDSLSGEDKSKNAGEKRWDSDAQK